MKNEWKFCLENQDMIRNSVLKAGVWPNHPNFNDLVSEGHLHFIDLYRRWSKPIINEEDEKEFLRVCAKHIKDRTIDGIRHYNLGGIKGDITEMEFEIDGINIPLMEMKEMIFKSCTPREIMIINRRIEGYSQREIAKQIHCSEARVSQILRKVRRSFCDDDLQQS